MHKLIPLVALLAAPASAQDTVAWQISGQGQGCVLSGEQSGVGTLSLQYDAATQVVTLTSTNQVETPLPSSGTIDWTMVFLDNGREKFDDQWDVRRFTFSRDGNAVRFTTRFSGKANVDQFFGDLANSRKIGFLKKRDVVIAYDLAGIAGSISGLRDCAA
jgi:hypothetical protein